jgi:hypothetical protein
VPLKENLLTLLYFKSKQSDLSRLKATQTFTLPPIAADPIHLRHFKLKKNWQTILKLLKGKTENEGQKISLNFPYTKINVKQKKNTKCHDLDLQTYSIYRC